MERQDGLSWARNALHSAIDAKKCLMSYKRKVVLISGSFSPSQQNHSEHIRFAREVAGRSGLVYCIVLNDGQIAAPEAEADRLAWMVSMLRIDKAFLSIDNDHSVCKSIKLLYNVERNKPTHFAFIGEDCREEKVCQSLGIKTLKFEKID